MAKNIELNELREICHMIPDVCLKIILEYSHSFEGKLRCLLIGHKLVSEVKQLPNGKIISFGEHSWRNCEYIEDNTIRIWDNKTGKLLLVIDNFEWIIQYLILKNNNVCIRDTNRIKIYDTNTGEIISKFHVKFDPIYRFINELSDNNIIFNNGSNDQLNIILLNTKTQDIKIYQTKYNFYNKSIRNLSTVVLSNNKFVAVIREGYEYQICLFDIHNFQTPESIISYKTDNMEFENIHLEIISNDRVLFHVYRRFPIIVDFKSGTIKEIDINKILNLNDCFILKLEIISQDKGLFLINRDIPGCTFLILNFDTFEFNLYSSINHLDSIFNFVSENQIVFGRSNEIIVCDLDSKNSTANVKYKFKCCSNSGCGTILNNLNIVIPTENKGELAIYY